MENLAGVIKFTSDNSATEEEKPYIPVYGDVSQKALAEFMLDRWKMKAPDVMISLVTGVYHYKHLGDDYSLAFQKGLTRVMNTSNAWILTHGFHTGIVKLLGDAVRDEFDKRTVFRSRAIRRYNKRVSQITLIGVATDSLVNDLDAFRTHAEGGSGRRRVELDLAGFKPTRQKFNLDQFHTHFIIVNGSTSQTITTFRTDMERELQRFSSVRKNFGTELIENSSDEEDSHSVGPKLGVPSRQNMESTAARMGVPLVALFIQGGPYEIQQVLTYIRGRTPVVVVKGSGMAADLFAWVYEEVLHSPDVEKELQKLKPEILKRTESLYPRMKQGDPEEKMECTNQLLDCMRAEAHDDVSCITILDLTRASGNLADLDLYILRAIFGIEKSRDMDWKEQVKRDLILCLQWNRPDFAKEEIIQRLTKAKVDKDVFRMALLTRNREQFVDLILHNGFRTHKFLSHRMLLELFRHAEDTEFFSVTILENLLGYPPGTVVGERFLLEDINWIITTFTQVDGFMNCYELSTNSIGIYSTEPSVAERKSLNALIVWSVLMGRNELTKILWKYVEDPIPVAIFVSALWHGLSHFCREPELENQLRHCGKEYGMMGMDVLGMAYRESLERTFQLLDREFPDFGRRTPVQLAYDARNRWFLAHPCCQKWINRIYMGHITIASPHPGSPDVPDYVKILLSAFLIFPMFFWIHFPSLDPVEAKQARRESKLGEARILFAPEEKLKLINQAPSVVEVDLEESESNMASARSHGGREEKRMWLMQLQQDQQRAYKGDKRRRLLRRMFFGNLRGTQVQFSLIERIYLLWTAPITKFWTFQFFYWMYLLLFSVVTLMPVCEHDIKSLVSSRPGDANLTKTTSTTPSPLWDYTPARISPMDIVLWIWTALIATETFLQNFKLMTLRHVTQFLTKLSEMFFMISFLTAYFVVRVIGQQPKLLNAFSARTLMCIGMLYFTYRLIGIFFPLSGTLGPMLIRMKFMIGEDFANFMKMILPFLLASGVAMQAILFPDRQLTLEVFRAAFHRSFFTLFMVDPVVALQYNDRCEAQRFSKEHARDYCTAGDYEDPNCATIGWWSYLIVIQFMVMIKLILSTLLYALFTATQLRIESESDAIWQFERYSVVMEFAARPAIPPPFSILQYFFGSLCYSGKLMLRCCTGKFIKRTPSFILRSRRAARHEDYHYWKGLVREHFRQDEEKKRDKEVIARTLEKVVQINENLNFQTGNLKQVKERVDDVEGALSRLLTANEAMKLRLAAISTEAIKTSDSSSPAVAT